ncbi:MAG TPA: hypothetical protein VKB96_04485, partial [Gammaproteobacteria bacterium]|nr:hypothetical protein [Gammaproteobacteria bacterium]
MPRGAKVGERRGGRQKGTPNKRTIAVAEKLEALGCDPIKQIGQIAMDERVEVSVRVQVLKELCQYIAPKRKAMEVTGEDGGPIMGELTLSAWLEPVNGQSLG